MPGELRVELKSDLTNYEEKVNEITTKKKFFEACWVLQHFAVKVSDREIRTHFLKRKRIYFFQFTTDKKSAS